MAQFYTLEEAARVLGMSPEELRTKAQQREVRAFMDNGSWRFRVADVDELARRRGMGSDPDLALQDLELAAPLSGDSGIGDLDLSDFQLGVATPDASNPPPVTMSSTSDDDILLDDMALPPSPLANSSSTIIGMEPLGKRPSDSDVRLIPDDDRGSSDSDVRLAAGGTPSDSDVTLVTDELETIGSSDDAIPIPDPAAAARANPFGSSGEIRVRDAGDEEGSDFELTPADSSAGFRMPESGSDFELTALDASGEFDIAPAKPSDSDVTGALPSESGINLARPSDSGINLQGLGSLDLGEPDSIELAPLDEDDEPARPAPRPPAPTGRPASPSKADLSATALPTRAEKDIFEDTDFEVDALDTDQEDRTIQLEAASDFDLDEGDSGSEVFALDEDEVDQNAATAMAPVPAITDDEDEDDGVAAAVGDDLDDAASDEAWEVEGAAAAPVAARGAAGGMPLTTSAAGAEWGGLWVGLLMVATVFMLLLSFVALDLVRNMYSYQGDVPVASGIVKAIAGLVSG